MKFDIGALWGLSRLRVRSFCISLFLLFTSLSYGADLSVASDVDDEGKFITAWEIDGGEDFYFPLQRGFSYNFTIEWGDGNTEEISINSETGLECKHFYADTGLYLIKITSHDEGGESGFPTMDIKADQKDKIRAVLQWGAVDWRDLQHMFAGCYKLDVLAEDKPDLYRISSLEGMFDGCSSLHGDALATWNVSSVVKMTNTFRNAVRFDQDLSSWEITSLTDAEGMFDGVQLSVANYDALLISWAAQVEIIDASRAIKFSAGMSQYCFGENARSKLIEQGWGDGDATENSDTDIADGGKDCSVDDPASFITEWEVRITDGKGNVEILLNSSLAYDFTIDWGDGSSVETIKGSSDVICKHEYTATGVSSKIFKVRINANNDDGFPQIYFEPLVRLGKAMSWDNRLQLIDVVQWGDIKWKSMVNAFANCESLDVTAKDVPDLSRVTDMTKMFYGCNSLQGTSAFDRWDVSNVEYMTETFRGDQNFDQYLGSWNTGNVKSMAHMFYGARYFDHDLSGWDISSLEDAEQMLFGITLSIANYDALLISWAAQWKELLEVDPSRAGISFRAGQSEYCAGEDARTYLNSKGWGSDGHGILDGGKSTSIMCVASSNDFFIITCKVPAGGSVQIPLQLTPSVMYNFTIDWGDGTINRLNDWGGSLNSSHTYKNTDVDTFTIKIAANEDSDGDGDYDTGFPRMVSTANKDKPNTRLLTVEQWGTIKWASTQNMFTACKNLEIKATDIPDLSGVSNMDDMFAYCENLVGNTSMNNWDVSTITSMKGLFKEAALFNQVLDNWDVSGVENMSEMFKLAVAFDQDIGDWNISKLTDATEMFEGVTLSLNNYDSLLIGWNRQLEAGSGNSRVVFSGGNSQYCAAVNARANMIDDKEWTITDGGPLSIDDSFRFVKDSINVCISNRTKITLNGSEKNIVYQLYNLDDNTKEGSAVEGNGKAIDFYVSPSSITRYYIVAQSKGDINGACASDPLDTAVVNVMLFAVGGEIIPSYSTMLPSSGSIPLTLKAYGGNVVRWEQSNNRAFVGASVIDNTSPEYTATNLSETTYYRALIKIDECDSAYSRTSTIEVSDDAGKFITKWYMDAGKVVFPLTDGASYDFTIEWGDGSVQRYTKNAGDPVSDCIHTYAEAGVYTIKITGHQASGSPRISVSESMKIKILTVEQWGDIKWTDLSRALYGCVNVDVVAKDLPDLRLVKDMTSMFYGCTSLRGTNVMTDWDVSLVEKMDSMFWGADKFDQGIGAWNISKLESASKMLEGAKLSVRNYDSLLISWNRQVVSGSAKSGIPFHGGNSQYCKGEDARTNLITEGCGEGATIPDGGKKCTIYELDYFITRWNIDANGSIEIPTIDGHIYDFTIDWGDGSALEVYSGNSVVCSHTYTNPIPKTVTIKIVPNKDVDVDGSEESGFSRLSFDGHAQAADIIEVVQWGTSRWRTMEDAFKGCVNLDVVAEDAPDLTRTENASGMFSGCSNLIGNEIIADWDLAKVSNMSNMFNGAEYFNIDIGEWQVAKVSDMSSMFSGATAFDQDLGKWDISSLTNADKMFSSAKLSLHNYDSLLIGWQRQENVKENVKFDGGLSLYCAGEDARNALIDKGWGDGTAVPTNATTDISDGGMASPSIPSNFENIVYACADQSVMLPLEGATDLLAIYQLFDAATDLPVGNAMRGTGGTINFEVKPTVDTSKYYVKARYFDDLSGKCFSQSVDTTVVYLESKAADVNPDIATFFEGSNVKITVSDYVGTLKAWQYSTDKTFATYNEITTSVSDVLILDDITDSTYVRAVLNSAICGDFYSDTAIVKFVSSSNFFITEWEVEAGGKIKIPTHIDSSYNFTISWGDGTETQVFAGDAIDCSHEYSSEGTYTVRIAGNVDKDNDGSEESGFPCVTGTWGNSLRKVTQWGSIRWSTMFKAFYNSIRMDVTASDAPDLSEASNLASMFENCVNLKGSPAFATWDVSSAKTMESMFYNTKFNTDIGSWNVSQLENAAFMFSACHSFDNGGQPLTWTYDHDDDPLTPEISATGNIKKMGHMFKDAELFNRNIGSWNVKSVEDMSYMFINAKSYNNGGQPLAWTYDHDADPETPEISATGNVKKMTQMFDEAANFNQDIGHWDVGQVLIMKEMFKSATSFDQNLGSWNIKSLVNADGMFDNAKLSIDNYDSLLIGWNRQLEASLAKQDVKFHGGASRYCAGESARANLIANGWGDGVQAADTDTDIIDGGSVAADADIEFIEDAVTACVGETIELRLDTSQLGFTYQLYNKITDDAEWAKVPGNNDTISFQITPTAAADYYVLAVNDDGNGGACDTVRLNGEVAVTVGSPHQIPDMTIGACLAATDYNINMLSYVAYADLDSISIWDENGVKIADPRSVPASSLKVDNTTVFTYYYEKAGFCVGSEHGKIYVNGLTDDGYANFKNKRIRSCASSLKDGGYKLNSMIPYTSKSRTWNVSEPEVKGTTVYANPYFRNDENDGWVFDAKGYWSAVIDDNPTVNKVSVRVECRAGADDMCAGADGTADLTFVLTRD
ncbi:MAG: BspA family leucine-rich repeat surface protein [Bacteroidales bacterium]